MSARREFSRHFKAFNRSPLICPDNKGRRDKLFRKWSINTIPCQYSSYFSLRKTINTTNKSSFFLAHGRRNWQLSGTAILVAKMFFYSPWQSKWHVTSCYICRNMERQARLWKRNIPRSFSSLDNEIMLGPSWYLKMVASFLLVTRKCLRFYAG